MALMRFNKPALYRKDMSAVLETMVNENIGPGERKKEFLKAFATLVSKKDGLALRSYIDAICSALFALGIGDGDSVIISVLSPNAYREAFKRMGVHPVLVDINKEGLIETEECEKKIKEGVKAIVYFEPVCQVPVSFDEIKQLGLPVIEDVSESLGSFYGESYKATESSEDESYFAGKGGDIVICRFEEDSIISTGGGAAVVTNNEEMVERLKGAYSSPFITLSDINASLGIVQIANIDSLLKRRGDIYRVFSKAQKKGDSIFFGSESPLFTPNGYGFSVTLKGKVDEAFDFAKRYSVPVKKTFSDSIGYRYQDRYDLYPKAVGIISRNISFPLYPFLSSGEIESVERVISHLF